MGEQHGESIVRELLTLLGEDPERGGLQETPKRYLAAMRFWTSGNHQIPSEVLKEFEDGSEGYDELVFQGAIPLWSMCEHHLAPFFGVAHIGYIPNGKIVGLSKFSRLVDVFARRLQVQERLTREIAESLFRHLNPKAVGVVLRCRHSCIESRGVQKAGSMTYTSHLLGLFKTDVSARAEFLRFVERADGSSESR